MTEQNESTQFQRDGDIAEITEDTENEDSEESSTEENDTDDTQTDQGEGKNTDQDPDKDKPFHEHPRWKQRETEWETRFNQQEARHQEDLKAIREEFGAARKANETQEMPIWFGGTQEQWDAYRKDRDVEIKAAEDRAYERINNAKTSEEKAIEEATAYMQSEMATIESDKTLNPNGIKVDPNKLLKVVMDNELVDSKGRWNYRAGFKILQAQTPAPKAPVVTKERKAIAGATGTESKPETKPAPYKTSADFKKSKPW